MAIFPTTKQELRDMAATPGAEEGPLGAWPAARLEAPPEAGDLLCLEGTWYLAVAGRRREGYRGNMGGLYARWVTVPAEIAAGWDNPIVA